MFRRRSHAQQGASRPPTQRYGAVFGWGLALVALVALALIVGRPGSDRGASEPTPSPTTDAPPQIRFGASLDAATGRVLAAQQTFDPTQTLAYSADLREPSTSGEVFVQVLRISASSETEVQAPTAQQVPIGSQKLGVEIPAERLTTVWGPGDYVMRIYAVVGGPVAAEGRFSLVDGA